MQSKKREGAISKMTTCRNQFIRPHKIRLEASTACQLNCPSCPTAAGEVNKQLGTGFLAFEDFKRLIDQNPGITSIELSNWGEIFLNKDLVRILEYAYQKHVSIQAINGANLNHVSEDVLEALVRYKMRVLTCSIDGAGQETYAIYRRNGNYDRVIRNIELINKYKAQYRSRNPMLIWQFVAFGHNEHEIQQARLTARRLNMGFKLKLSWGNLYLDDFSPVQNPEAVRAETALRVASRAEYRDKYQREYINECCVEMWSEPQINYDGRVLGCPVNYWGDYGNAFRDGLSQCLNNEKMAYARDMLMGKKDARADIPCTICKNYQSMRDNQTWVQEADLRRDRRISRGVYLLQKYLLGCALTRRLLMMYRHRK